MPDHRVDAHFAGCVDCRGWAAAVGGLPLVLGEAPVERVALEPGVLAALLAEARPRQPVRGGAREWRIVLAVLALAQLVVASTGVLAVGGGSAHLVHELTSWDLGLAAGFLFLAWQPSRAWGALPLVGVLVAFLAGTSLLDLASGHTLLGRESVHLLELAGLGCLWMLARRMPRSSIVLKLA